MDSTPTPRRTDEVFVEVVVHRDVRRLNEYALICLVADARQFGPRFLQLVEGARQLLSLAVLIAADIHDEAVPDRPVLQFDLADWFLHR